VGCVYLIRNKMNSKLYVGKTIHSYRKRKREHKSAARKDSKTAFHCALRKYGSHNFSGMVLFETDDPEELDELEMMTIDFLRTVAPNGYNLTEGGEGGRLSDETKEKVRQSKLGKPRPDMISNQWNRGRRRVGWKHTKETIEKNRQSQLGKKHSEETKQKMSLSHKGKIFSAEHRRKLGKVNKGRKRSPETIRKIRITRLKQSIERLEIETAVA